MQNLTVTLMLIFYGGTYTSTIPQSHDEDKVLPMSPSDHTLYDEQSNDVGVEIHSDIEDPCVDSAESSDTVLYTPPRANDDTTSQNRHTASHDDIATSHNNDTTSHNYGLRDSVPHYDGNRYLEWASQLTK